MMEYRDTLGEDIGSTEVDKLCGQQRHTSFHYRTNRRET